MKRWIPILAISAFVVAAGLLVAQSLPDADFNLLTAQGTPPLTLGAGAAAAICIEFNDDDDDDSICYDETTGTIIADTVGFGVSNGNANSKLQFYDSDGGTSAIGAFQTVYGIPDANDSTFQFQVYNGGTLATRHQITTSGGDPIFQMSEASGVAQFTMGYDGVNGSMYAFFSQAQGYYFDDDVYIDENATGGLIMKDSGGSCFRVSLAATQTYTVTNGTTDRAFDANTQFSRVWTHTTFVPSGTSDHYFLKLTAATNWNRISCITQVANQDITIQECDSAGASCGNIANTVTCDTNGQDSASFTDGSADADDWIYIDYGTTGIGTTSVSITLWGTEPTHELSDVVGSIIADLDTLNILGTSTDRVASAASATCPTVTP